MFNQLNKSKKEGIEREKKKDLLAFHLGDNPGARWFVADWEYTFPDLARNIRQDQGCHVNV
jgi:hypothetical protein